MDKRIEDINSRWIQTAPYFAEFLLNFTYEETDKCSSIGIALHKQFFKLVYNKKFLDKVSIEELEGLLVHEILHILRLTFNRGKEYGKEGFVRFNVASDIANNYEIERTTIGSNAIKLPFTECKMEFIQKDGYKGNVVAEEIYEWLQQQDRKGKGSGKDGDPQPLDDHSMMEEIKKALEQNPILKEKIRSVIQDAEAKGAGTLPNNLKSIIDQLTQVPRLPFEILLKRKFQTYISGKVHKRNTWKKINKRDLPIKGKTYDGSIINIFVDTSGSCWSQEIFSRFFAYVEMLTKKNKVHLGQFDTEVKSFANYKKNDWKKIELVGCGGTDAGPVFEFLHTNREDKFPLVIFTDGDLCRRDFNYFNIEPLWVIVRRDLLFEIKQGNL